MVRPAAEFNASLVTACSFGCLFVILAAFTGVFVALPLYLGHPVIASGAVGFLTGAVVASVVLAAANA